MENTEPAPTRVLDIGKVNHNKWTKSEYEGIKKTKGMQRSIRGSQIARDVISNLRVRGGTLGASFSMGSEHSAAANYNSIYQRHYGESFGNYLEKHKVN